jgi:hypothetical protein
VTTYRCNMSQNNQNSSRESEVTPTRELNREILLLASLSSFTSRNKSNRNLRLPSLSRMNLPPHEESANIPILHIGSVGLLGTNNFFFLVNEVLLLFRRIMILLLLRCMNPQIKMFYHPRIRMVGGVLLVLKNLKN